MFPMQPAPPLSGSVSKLLRRRRIHRVARQLIIGCGIGLVSLYAFRVFGLEVATRDLLIALALGITLIIIGVKIEPLRRVPRVH